MGYGCMGEFYWEIDSVPSWNIILKEITAVFCVFKQEGAKLFESRNAKEIQYVNEKSLERFDQMFCIMMEALNQYEKQSKSLPLIQWILLGSVIEITLQTILAVYHSDYLKDRWQQWDDFDKAHIEEALDNALEKEVQDKKLSAKQKKSICGAIADKIQEHTIVHPIDRIMLDELIQFSEKAKLFDNDKIIPQLRVIQKNRNCIHAFSEREIDNWDVLRSSVNALGYILSNFSQRFAAENFDKATK